MDFSESWIKFRTHRVLRADAAVLLQNTSAIEIRNGDSTVINGNLVVDGKLSANGLTLKVPDVKYASNTSHGFIVREILGHDAVLYVKIVNESNSAITIDETTYIYQGMNKFLAIPAGTAIEPKMSYTAHLGADMSKGDSFRICGLPEGLKIANVKVVFC